MFPCEYYEIFKKTYFEEHLQTAASNIHKIVFYSPLVQSQKTFTVYGYNKLF